LSPHTLTLAGLVARQMRARWTSYLPTAVGLAVAIGLASSVTLVQARAEDASLTRTMNSLGAQGLVSVRLTGVRQADAYAQFRSNVQQAAQQEKGLVAPRSTLLYSGRYTPATINGVDVGSLGSAYASTVTPLELAVLEDLQSHVTLERGGWPAVPVAAGALQVTLPEDAAAAAHLKLGDTQCMVVLSPGKYSVCVHVVGIWMPVNRSDAYWGPDQAPPIAAFIDDATYFATLKAEADADTQPQLVSVATVVLEPDVDAIRAAGADEAVVRLRRLHADFGVARPDAVVISNLETALDRYTSARDVAEFAVQLVAVQLLLIALFCVWLLAGTLLAQQAQVIAMWRSRGWSWLGVSWLLWLELLIVAIPAVPAGITGGWLASEAVARAAFGGQSYHPDAAKLALPIAAVLVGSVALLAGQAALAARHGVLATRGATSRPATSWWRRRYVDIALGIVAVPLLLQAAFFGSASARAMGTVNDPATLALPGLAVALIALAALRLLQPVAAVLTRASGSLSARLAGMQLLRAPGQHAGLAVLLMLAVAIGVFGSTYIATAAKNGEDRASYQVGADARGTFSGAVTVPPDQIPVDGAAARSSVFRGYARAANEDVAMIAVEPFTFKSVVYTRDDLASTPLPDLVQRLADRETGGLFLPPGASNLSIWVHGSNTGGTMTAHLSDPHGRPAHADLGSLDFSGWRQLTGAIAADGGVLDQPLRFRDLAVSGVNVAGEIGLSGLAAGGKPVESFSEQFEGLRGPVVGLPFLWWRSDWDTGAAAESLNPTMDVPRDGSATVHFRVVPAHIPTYLRPPPPEADRFVGAPLNVGAIPTIVSSQLLSRFGLAAGKLMQVEVDHIAVTAVIVGVADHFPTLYPELGDFMVLARHPLLIQLAYGEHQRPWPNEVWVRASPGGADAALRSLRSAPGLVEVFDRRAVADASAHSPQRLELESNLILGFVAAVVLALMAFALHFLVLARARLSDYAVLEANGMPQSLIRRSLLAEQSILIAFCVVCGAVLGLVAAFVVLPGLQLDVSAQDNVPQTIVTVDPRLLLLTLAAVIGGGIASGPLIAASTERPRVMSELRALG